eukprot:TRINITY_DN1809_c0_g2_i1.p2 TRINITY_DN1809_c0_g2~~TRINITY_DN1809_c0_g2_i1.p2  ORF type:complete len:104 (+),score=1.63 TRINITY_DN1809_c0_g2_i1:617-928(+)
MKKMWHSHYCQTMSLHICLCWTFGGSVQIKIYHLKYNLPRLTIHSRLFIGARNNRSQKYVSSRSLCIDRENTLTENTNQPQDQSDLHDFYVQLRQENSAAMHT